MNENDFLEAQKTFRDLVLEQLRTLRAEVTVLADKISNYRYEASSKEDMTKLISEIKLTISEIEREFNDKAKSVDDRVKKVEEYTQVQKTQFGVGVKVWNWVIAIIGAIILHLIINHIGENSR